MTDFRTLCAELADELEAWIAYGDEADCARAHAVVDRARTAVATPPPKPPTAIEIIDLSIEIDDAGLGIVEFARAALEKWGHG